MIESCVYAYNEDQRRMAYEIYVTDRLKGINDSLASFYGGQSARMRYAEILDQMKGKKEETRTAEEVISAISEKIERLTSNERI